MAAPARAEEIPRFIDSQIKPHLNKVLRVLGNERPAAPIEFIADCFINKSVPERSAPRSWDESLMSYLLSHDVVARVERAIATCAIHHATVENPLEYIGNLLREAPEPEEAMMPRAAQTRLRPAALAVPGGGAGDGDGSSDVSPRADLPPPLSPSRSPGSIATPLSKTKMESLSLQSPSPRPLDMTRSTSYDTISRGSHHRLYQVVRPAVVRAGVEPNSLRTERLRIGERLTILESREFGGVTRVRFARGWTSMWAKDNTPILVPVDESDCQAVSEYRIRSPSMLMADLDPWSEPQAENAVGVVPLVQIRVSDGGETFVETSNGWHCVSGWENMKALVPHWKPVTPSPLPGEGGDSGEGGDPAFGPSGESLEGSEDGSTITKMRKAQTPRKGRGRQNSLLVRAGQTESFDAIRLESLPMPGGLFGANSTWKRNMSFFSQHQAEKKENIGTAGGPPQMALAVSQEDAMRLAQQEVDGG